MQNEERILHLDICNYNREKLCPLYDNQSDVSGQATDVFVTTERNGWKELSFTLPSVYMNDNKQEENYRLDYLKADFLIRLIDEKEPDWFIISEPKITHNAYSKTMQITAGHISQLLKFKNLGLEFSDDEGNNVGTAEELATTILKGTGWSLGYVYPFAEKNGDTKRRSLRAPAKTGAFKLIATMCDLFDAKPIYHGDSKTVDIVPINPFSEPDVNSLPDVANEDVVELHYGKNVSNVTRTLNTENIVTKLYAYGSYGDKTSGYCGIDECKHVEYIYMVTDNCAANQTYFFTFEDAAGISLTYHFTPHTPISTGSRLVYSLLDPCSMMYIWDGGNKKAYPVAKGTMGSKLPATVAKSEVQNWFQFVMNFDYYREVDLLTDEMIQIIADYQRNAPVLYQNIADASAQMSDSQTTLSETIGYIDFCKLDVLQELPATYSPYTSIALNKETHEDGVIFRSDYEKSKDNYFKWRVTESLNTDGDPINAAAAIVYIVHDTNPVTWDKAYLKQIDDEDNPSILTLWSETGSMNINADTDQFFLFSYNGINGHLGALESNDESAVMSLEEAVRVVTVDHPVIFTDDTAPGIMRADVNGYGWLWQYDPNGSASNLYFAYADKGDEYWKYVYFQDTDPGGAEEGSYWFDWRDSVLCRRQNSAWVTFDTVAEQRIAALFATVYMFGKARDRYYQGLYENYTYTVPAGETLSPGNYFIENEYSSYWAFTTTETLSAGDTLTYNYDDTWITQNRNGTKTTLKPKGYRFDNVNYHASNVFNGKMFEAGYIGDDGAPIDSETQCRSQSYISVVPQTTYLISGTNTALTIHFYDDKQGWLSKTNAGSSFITPAGCTYIRWCADVSSENFTEYDNIIVHADNSENIIVIEDLNYVRLNSTASGEVIGLISCIDKFVEYANLTYITYYDALISAQNELSELEHEMMQSTGDLYREGWWQDSNYVDGDETKLYEDTLDNLKEVSKPEATYNITYVHLQNSNADNFDYGVVPETAKTKWPNITISSAVHLLDPEILVNTWAFIDKIQKCYDKPWQTKITINTNLSTIAQRSFTDVMTNIATVASEMKGKTSYYDKTLDSAATNSDITSINAELNRNERELLNTASKVNNVGDVAIKNQSQIKQTAEMISSEVLRAVQAEGKLLSETKSLIEQSATSITTSVSETYVAKESAVSNVIVKYYLSSSTTELKDGEWLDVAPPWTEGMYMWTKTVTSYANGTSKESDPTCIAGAAGADANSIVSVTNYYLRSDLSSGITLDNEDWDTIPPEINADYPYLWNYEEIKYTKTPTYISTPCVIGRYGDDGDKGVGIDHIEEFYARSDSNAVAPTSWDTSPPKLTQTEKYLWNYEIIYYTDGTNEPTDKRIIGVYGDTGDTGNGVISIDNYYLRSALASGVTIDSSDWDKTPPSINTDYPYLWNYEVINYTSGESKSTEPCVIGRYGTDGSPGDPGVGIVSIEEYYARGISNTDAPAPIEHVFTVFSAMQMNTAYWLSFELASGETVPYYFTATQSAMRPNDTLVIPEFDDYSTPYILHERNGATYTLNSGTSANMFSCKSYEKRSPWSNTPSTLTPIYKYLWNYEVINFTDGSSRTGSKRVIGVYGDTGSNGRGISSVKAQYYLSTSKTEPTNGSWEDTMPSWQADCYIWTRNLITYTDGTTSTTEPYCDTGWEAANEKGKVWFQDEAPTSDKVSENDLWIDTSNDTNTPKRYLNGEWVAVSDGIAVEAQAGVTTTKSAIRSIVTLGVSYEGEDLGFVGSTLEQTLNGLHSEVTGQDLDGNEVESSLKQTVNGLTTSVSTIEKMSIITQTNDTITAAVKTQNASGAGNEFNTSSVSINDEGVSISTGGNVSIGAGGSFTVESGNNFNIDEDGKLSATNAFLSGDVYSKGYPVLTTNDVIISTSQPTNPKVGMIWIKPGSSSYEDSDDEEGSGEESETPSSAVVVYSADFSVASGTREYIGGSESASNMSVTLSGNGTNTTSTNCSYKISVPIYINTRKNYTVGGRLIAKVENSSGKSIEADLVISQNNPGTGARQIVLEDTGESEWLGDGDTLTITVWVETYGAYYRGNILTADGTITVTCTAS